MHKTNPKRTPNEPPKKPVFGKTNWGLGAPATAIKPEIGFRSRQPRQSKPVPLGVAWRRLQKSKRGSNLRTESAKRCFLTKRTRQPIENKGSGFWKCTKRTPNEPRTNPGKACFWQNELGVWGRRCQDEIRDRAAHRREETTRQEVICNDEMRKRAVPACWGATSVGSSRPINSTRCLRVLGRYGVEVGFTARGEIAGSDSEGRANVGFAACCQVTPSGGSGGSSVIWSTLEAVTHGPKEIYSCRVRTRCAY